MPIEIEAKMKLDDQDAMAARLCEAGAEFLGQYLETNIFFDTEDRALLAADQGLRLRVAQNLDSGEVQCVITHKGSNRAGPLKTREETELVVNSARDAELLLNRLGFLRRLSFQKRRRSWRLHDCRIELDQVPILGSFMEIEGPSEAAVMSLRERLGMSHTPLIKTSYIAMLSAHLQERGEPLRDILFPSAPDPNPAHPG